MTAPSEMVAWTTSQIYLMIYLLDIKNIVKYVIKLATNLNFCANWLIVKHRKGWRKQ